MSLCLMTPRLALYKIAKSITPFPTVSKILCCWKIMLLHRWQMLYSFIVFIRGSLPRSKVYWLQWYKISHDYPEICLQHVYAFMNVNPWWPSDAILFINTNYIICIPCFIVIWWISYEWCVIIGSCNGWVPSGNTTLLEAILIKFSTCSSSWNWDCFVPISITGHIYLKYDTTL